MFGAIKAFTLIMTSPSVDLSLTSSSMVMEVAELNMIVPVAVILCSASVTVMPSRSLKVNPPGNTLLTVSDLKSGKLSSPSPPSYTSWPIFGSARLLMMLKVSKREKISLPLPPIRTLSPVSPSRVSSSSEPVMFSIPLRVSPPA